MILHIDTQDQKVIRVTLKRKGEVIKSLSEENKFGSQILLPLIEKILKELNLVYKDLKGIEVETGPGSFTGIRVGVSVANTLAYSLNIPVNGEKLETEVQY
ncbi:tRNA (adenosine(37)-N6)-threonylcarbamoyltransferase complex dimerization subunit type 1 TsaB [Candidatus Daviesbacteria bacterium]|nr:tRNA (adenosine(37)-N6)-threonylcarbamoyltransferase complex dimerization subunit type 1 TsaB [Candidatus Daviesbacteria bacterium]